jgi:hypothetical protein
MAERHLNRHRQRDEEAGSEGRGVLNTRKRSWKAPDGRVVPKRPSTWQRSQASPDSQPSSSGQSQTETSPIQLNIGTEIPISPPTSVEHPDLGQHQDFHEDHHDATNASLDGNSWSLSGHAIFDESSNTTTQQNFWIDPGLLPAEPPSSSHRSEVLYDEIFQPDTASSFNMPFTTAANYNWLFDQTKAFDPVTNQRSLPGDSGFDFSVSEQAIHPIEPLLHQLGTEYPLSIPHTGSNYDQPGMTRLDNMDPIPDNSSFDSAQRRQTTGEASLSEPHGRHQSIARPPIGNMIPAAGSLLHFENSELERPLSTIQTPSNLPVIEDDVRDRLLEIIDSAQPVIPSGPLEAWDHPLLSLASLQDYSDLFFTKFNTAYPLIHCATFKPNQTEGLLLLSILLLGATYSSRDAHQLAVCMHDVVRPQIFAHAGFSAKPELWVLQTILLVECFGKSRAGQKQHDMSHLFHGLLINLIRRSDCQSVQTVSLKELPEDVGEVKLRWLRWAESEEKKRLALMCFMWDTQHAVLFCQSLCMSAFELRLTMPCSQALWEAQDESKWKSLGSVELQPQISFLAALKSFIFTSNNQRPTQLNALSRILLLHGLMSIAWDMQRRDETALGVVNFAGGDNWRNRIGDAYDLWKADFDAYCAGVAIKQRQQRQTANDMDVDSDAIHREFATFSTAYNAVYHAAHILLSSSFLDIQIYAGARHILGRPVSRNDYIRSERVVKRWAAGPDVTESTSKIGSQGLIRNGTRSATSEAAAKAAYHAACLLHEASLNLDEFDSMGLFHVPWCLYLATLTMWAFQHTRPSRWGGNEEDESEMVWDARKEMDGLLSSMSGSKSWNLRVTEGRRSTGGLVWVMAETLGKVRWGVIHSGVLVLKALIPLRLINQYESS